MYKKREWFPNSEYHITSRGNRRNDIFKDEEDFQVYITIIENSLEHFKGQFELICYCLMDNHVHLLLKSKDRHIKFLMSRINSIYASKLSPLSGSFARTPGGHEQIVNKNKRGIEKSILLKFK